MDKNQYHQLRGRAPETLAQVTAACLKDQTPRTLLYGYTCERLTWHIYLADNAIHKVVYDHNNTIVEYKDEKDGISWAECVPDKRLYPETCDFDFCVELDKQNISLPFTRWNDEREVLTFYGRVVDELRRIELIKTTG